MQASNQTGVQTLASSRTGALLPWGSSQTGALDLWVHPWPLHPLQHLLGLLLSRHHPSLVLKALGGELADGLVPACRGLLSLQLMQSEVIQARLCRFSGPMQPNGDLTINGAPSSGMVQGNAAARSADPTANLPDDVFGPDDLRRVEPKASHTRTAGAPFAGHVLRGGPDAGTAISCASMTVLCCRRLGQTVCH